MKHMPGFNGNAVVDFSGHYFDKFEYEREPDSFEFKVVSPPHEIEAEQTTYCYSFMDLHETLPEKHHITKKVAITNLTDSR
jgi:hypothetical protein